jgi:hypothetical protein
MHVDGERQVYTGCAQAIPSDGGNPVRRKRPPTAVRKRKMVTIGNRLELDSLKRRPVLSDLGSLDEILLGADRKSRELESTVVEVRPPTPLRFDSFGARHARCLHHMYLLGTFSHPFPARDPFPSARTVAKGPHRSEAVLLPTQGKTGRGVSVRGGA